MQKFHLLSITVWGSSYRNWHQGTARPGNMKLHGMAGTIAVRQLQEGCIYAILKLGALC